MFMKRFVREIQRDLIRRRRFKQTKKDLEIHLKVIRS